MKEPTTRTSTTLAIEGHVKNAHAESGAGWRDKAKFSQRLDPAWGVALNRERLVIRRAIPVMLAPLEHEEQRAQNFVTNLQ